MAPTSRSSRVHLLRTSSSSNGADESLMISTQWGLDRAPSVTDMVRQCEDMKGTAAIC
jgi:hypothetical protein